MHRITSTILDPAPSPNHLSKTLCIKNRPIILFPEHLWQSYTVVQMHNLEETGMS